MFSFIIKFPAKYKNAWSVIKSTNSIAQRPLSPCIFCPNFGSAKTISVSAHIKSIKEHRAKAERLKLQAEQQERFKSASGHKAFITEAEGELAATKYMQKNFPDFELASGFEQGTGFDQVWIKKEENEKIETIIIVEAKGPRQKLTIGAAKGDQMTRKWIENTANEWLKDPDVKEIAGEILKGLKDGRPKVIGKVIQATKEGGYKELPCPSWK